MGAFLSTGKGKLVRAPQFIDQCRNCQGPARIDVCHATETRTAWRMAIKCEAGCGIDESFVVEPKVRPKGSA